MNHWWTSRWFIVPTLMLVSMLAWMLYVGQHNHGLIEGRVVDANGQAVPNATIRIFDRGFVTHQERGRAQADAQGNFRITAADTESDIRHIVLSFGSNVFPVLEGQSIGIVPPGTRADGRDYKSLRAIECEVDLLPRVHGSALFQRGETQALVTITLGTGRDEQRVDGLFDEFSKRFMLDYNFPSFSVGECRPIRGPGRREIGHGVQTHIVVPSTQTIERVQAANRRVTL